MQKLSEDFHREAAGIWDNVSSWLEGKFGLETQGIPASICLSDCGTNPVVLTKDAIIVNSNMPNYNDLLQPIITKVCLQSSLKTELLCEQCIDDLSFELARQSIKDVALRSEWESIWSKHSPPSRISKIDVYHPSVAYRWLYSVAGENGINTFIRELTQRVRNQQQLSFEEYMQYFSARIRRFEITLDATELRLVKVLVESPNLQANEAAKAIGISQEWISKKIRHLQKRMVLRRFYRAPFSKIDIRMLHVLVGRGKGEADPFRYFKSCPFLYSYRKVVSGPWIALATLCIPENELSFQYLNQGLDTIAKSGFIIETHLINSSGFSHCFDYYSARSGGWDIPWELLTVHLQRIHSDDLAKSMPKIDVPESKTDKHLTELDMRIIDCVRMEMTSVSKIRSHLKIGQHRAAERLRELRDAGLLVKTWEAHNIGLNEHVFVHSQQKKVSRSLAAWSLRLPRAIASFSKEGELMLIVDLPRGGSYGLATALEGVGPTCSTGILSSETHGNWGFPSWLWDARFQKWTCPKKELEAWIEGFK